MPEDQKRALEALDEAIARGIADADAGRVKPAEVVFAELKARYAAVPLDDARSPPAVTPDGPQGRSGARPSVIPDS
jgi:hypothetical protein